MVLTFLKGWLLNWRVVAWTCLGYTVVPCFLIMLIPESPAWLVSKGRIEQASKSLAWINKYQPQPENKVRITTIPLKKKTIIKNYSLIL